MRKNLWLAVALVMIFPAVFFTASCTKKIVQTDLAPQAIGPYSQAVKVACSETLYVSGNIPLNPQTMEIVGNTAAEQCKQIMENHIYFLRNYNLWNLKDI